jgi:uncharacterized protein (UPF0335 family)
MQETDAQTDVDLERLVERVENNEAMITALETKVATANELATEALDELESVSETQAELQDTIDLLGAIKRNTADPKKLRAVILVRKLVTKARDNENRADNTPAKAKLNIEQARQELDYIGDRTSYYGWLEDTAGLIDGDIVTYDSGDRGPGGDEAVLKIDLTQDCELGILDGFALDPDEAQVAPSPTAARGGGD